MSVTTFIYFASVTDKLNGIAGFWGMLVSLVIIITTIIVIVCSACAAGGDKDSEKVLPVSAKFWRLSIFIGIVFGLIYALTPTSNTMYAMAAAKIGEDIAARKDVQGIASDATEALQKWIKKQITTDSDSKKKD